MSFDEATRQAAVRLGKTLSGKPWYSSVGITDQSGAPALIVYSRGRLPKGDTSVPESWDGLPVRIQQLGMVIRAQPTKARRHQMLRDGVPAASTT